MKRTIFSRALALLLCLCLLPAAALAEAADDGAVTRSNFSLSLNLHADGFPEGGTARYADWETFLSKVSLRGTVDTQRFLQPYSRVYFDGGLYLNEKLTVPFVYDGYHSYRYIRTPALAGASMHFQMHNFFEFMLKPYYFMDLPTQYLALLLYPEASYYVGDSYYTPIAALCAGTGNRTVEYADLYELCETLDLLVTDDMDYERMYFYITSLLVDLQASDMTLDALGYLEDWLDYLDPEQQGMRITVSGDTETYVIGTTTVFEKTVSGGATSFRLYLPNSEGYALAFTYAYEPAGQGAALRAKLTVTAEGAQRLTLALDADGLPMEGETEARGSVTIDVGGESLEAQPMPSRFEFRLSRDAAKLPYGMSLGVDWIHPVTEKPALTLLYKANMERKDESVLVDREYDNQDDFFHLNESYLEEYKERFLPSLALAFFPFVLEMPAGVINDTVAFLNQTGILASLGIE